MGRNWIKIETVTMDKPEVCVVATQLKLDPDAVVGKLVRLWSWAEVSRIDSNAMSVTFDFLDKLVGKKGFAAALMKAGWLKEAGGLLQFPHFDRHNGPTGKGRALTAQRVSRHRERKRTGNEMDVIDDDFSGIDNSGIERQMIRKVRAVNEKRNTVKELLENDLVEEKTEIKEINSGLILPGGKIGETPLDDFSSESATFMGGFGVGVDDETIPFDDSDEQSPFKDAVVAEAEGSAEEGPSWIVKEEVSETDGKVVESGVSAEGEEAHGEGEVPESGPAAQVKKGRAGRKSAVFDTPDQPMLF